MRFFQWVLPAMVFISLSICTATETNRPLTPSENAAVLTMQGPLGELLDLELNAPVVIDGPTGLDIYFDFVRYGGDKDAAKKSGFQKLAEHFEATLMPRARRIHAALEKLWEAAGNAPFSNDRWESPALSIQSWEDQDYDDRPLIIQRFPEKQRRFAIKVESGFTKVFVSWDGLPFDSKNPDDQVDIKFSRLFRESLKYSVRKARHLDDVLRLINPTFEVLAGFESVPFQYFMKENLPGILRPNADEDLFALLVREYESLYKMLLVSTSPLFYSGDLPPDQKYQKGALLRRFSRSSGAAFLLNFLAEQREMLLHKSQDLNVATSRKRKRVTQAAKAQLRQIHEDLRLLNGRLLDFFRSSMDSPSRHGTLIGMIELAYRALERQMLTPGDFTKTILPEFERRILPKLDSPWNYGHDPMKIDSSQLKARLELASLLQCISSANFRLRGDSSEDALMSFLLRLLHRDPAFEIDYIAESMTKDEPLKLRRRQAEIDTVVSIREPVYAFQIRFSKLRAKIIVDALAKFKLLLNAGQKPEADAYLEKVLCESGLL